MIKVSVIVPIFNSSKYLKKCLDSLIQEDDMNMEFILINDGSTDSSEDIIKSYNDSRIKYIKQNNRGIGATRNRGIKEASGEYIGFLDSDDYVSKNTFSIMYNYCKRNNLDIVICDYLEETSCGTKSIDLIRFQNTTLNKTPNLLNDIPLGPCKKFINIKYLIIKVFFRLT